eukprot:CFRG2904T1
MRTAIKAERGSMTISTSQLSQTDKITIDRVLRKGHCADLVDGQALISIKAEATIEEACDVLTSNKILSAPIWSEKSNNYIGMFDVADMMAFLLNIFEDKTKVTQLKDLKALISEGIQSMPVPVKWVSDLSLRNPLRTVYATDHIDAAVAIFSTGVHRVCVLNDSGVIIGILTQTAVANWLEKYATDLEPVLHKSLSDLHLGTKEIKSVNADDTVLSALSIMHFEQISSLAIIGQGSTLLGAVSMTDVKRILSTYEFEWLWRDCLDFVNMLRSDQAFSNDGKDSAPVFTVRSNSQLQFALRKMRATKVHRVWVVGSDGVTPAGVCSLTDIMRILAEKYI